MHDALQELPVRFKTTDKDVFIKRIVVNGVVALNGSAKLSVAGGANEELDVFVNNAAHVPQLESCTNRECLALLE